MNLVKFLFRALGFTVVLGFAACRSPHSAPHVPYPAVYQIQVGNRQTLSAYDPQSSNVTAAQ